MNKMKFPSASAVPPSGTGWSAGDRSVPPARPAPVRRAFEQMRQAHPKLNRVFADPVGAAQRFSGKFRFGGFAPANDTPPAARQWQPNFGPNVERNFNPHQGPNFQPNFDPHPGPNFQPYFNPHPGPDFQANFTPYPGPDFQPNFHPNAGPSFGPQMPPPPPSYAWNGHQQYQFYGAQPSQHGMPDYGMLVNDLANSFKAIFNRAVSDITASFQKIAAGSAPYGFHYQPGAYPSQYGWQPQSGQHGYYGGDTKPQPGQHGFYGGANEAFAEHLRSFYENAFHFNAQPGYTGQSYAHAAPPPNGPAGASPGAGPGGFRPAGAGEVPPQPAPAKAGLDIRLQRNGEQWKAVVAELQKKGMTKKQMAQWNKDFSNYINHGGSDNAAAFNKKYAAFIDGDINDSALRSNYLRLHKAIMKAVAETPA